MSFVKSIIKIIIDYSPNFSLKYLEEIIEEIKKKLNNEKIKVIDVNINNNAFPLKVTLITEIKTKEKIVFQYYDSDNHDLYNTKLEERVLYIDEIFSILFNQNDKINVLKIIITHCPKSKLKKNILFLNLHLNQNNNFDSKLLKEIKEIEPLLKYLKNNKNEFINSIILTTDVIYPTYLYIHDKKIDSKVKIIWEFFIKIILKNNISFNNCLDIIEKISEKHNKNIKIFRSILYI